MILQTDVHMRAYLEEAGVATITFDAVFKSKIENPVLELFYMKIHYAWPENIPLVFTIVASTRCPRSRWHPGVLNPMLGP